MRTLSMVFLSCSLAVLAPIANAQSVSILPLSKTGFCLGDSITVSFSVTGSFKPGNAFTLQLSDPSGSFTSGFRNIGSFIDTLPGTFTINTLVPSDAGSSAQYRLRIIATNPFITSADNGSNIFIGTQPSVHFMNDVTGASVGSSILFDISLDEGDANDAAFWEFDPSATPTKATTSTTQDKGRHFHFFQTAQYSTIGNKKVNVEIFSPGGCSVTETFDIHIFDCSKPAIPPDAIVINSDATVDSPGATYWVNSGFTLTTKTKKQTIFAEPGASVIAEAACVFYMKPGSVLKCWGQNSVIYGDGASISSRSNDYTLNCPALDFDYTNAPPNPAHPLSVQADLNVASITLSPNPTTGILSVQGLPSDDITVSVFTVLGETILEQHNLNGPTATLDLSKFASGTYYVRFSSPKSVVTKMVVRQ